MHEQRVVSGEVSLVVRDYPSEGGQNVIAVHGFPDTQAMWEPVAQRLADQHKVRVVTYDVRGAGGSTAPAHRDGYRTEHLVADLVAVIEATCPGGEAVHLLGHDWGSVQLWDAVTTVDVDPRLRGRIASFTSISGPCLDHLAHFARASRSRGRRLAGLRQMCCSWYVSAFCLPVLPELAWRHATGRIRQQLTKMEGLGHEAHFADTLGEDGAHGINLYRANIAQRMRHPRPGRTDVPVLTIVARHDSFLTPAVYDELGTFAPNGRRVDIDSGHWVARTDPDLIARMTGDFIREHSRS